jgi:hypothetical protein
VIRSFPMQYHHHFSMVYNNEPCAVWIPFKLGSPCFTGFDARFLTCDGLSTPAYSSIQCWSFKKVKLLFPLQCAQPRFIACLRWMCAGCQQCPQLQAWIPLLLCDAGSSAVVATVTMSIMRIFRCIDYLHLQCAHYFNVCFKYAGSVSIAHCQIP